VSDRRLSTILTLLKEIAGLATIIINRLQDIAIRLIPSMSLIKDSMVGSKVFITHAKQLPLTTRQRLQTFVKDYLPATIAFVRSGDGVLTVIEVATPEQAKKVAAALASGSLSTEALDVVLGESPQGRHLAQLHTELKQRELEINWTNRQW
jgi:hypothetical protein